MWYPQTAIVGEYAMAMVAIVEMQNQYTECCICFTVCTGESTKINSTKITNLSYFWKSTKIYSLENSLPYGNIAIQIIL